MVLFYNFFGHNTARIPRGRQRYRIETIVGWYNWHSLGREFILLFSSEPSAEYGVFFVVQPVTVTCFLLYSQILFDLYNLHTQDLNVWPWVTNWKGSGGGLIQYKKSKRLRKVKRKCWLQQTARGRQEPGDSLVTGSHPNNRPACKWVLFWTNSPASELSRLPLDLCEQTRLPANPILNKRACQ
jgi:hypothetical protein